MTPAVKMHETKPKDSGRAAPVSALLGKATPHEQVPVTLLPGRGYLPTRPIHGWMESFGKDRLQVTTERPLRPGKRARIRFQAPSSLTLDYEGMNCDFPIEVIGAQPTQNGSRHYELTLKWAEPLPDLVGDAVKSRQRKLGISVLAVTAFMLWGRWMTMSYFWYDPWMYFYSMTVGTYFFSRFLFACFYKPPAYTGYEPTISVVISVRNDRRLIVSAVRSVLLSDYPADKREFIIVDDGSNDGTKEVLEQLQRERPDLKVFFIPPSGKRFAMAKGFLEAKNDIVVVLDSDVILDRSALRHIVQGFDDPELGAVSGYTGVTNASKNMLTRMQELRYLVSFELMKAPESIFGCVTCCPGCLSAYRRTYLLNILNPWLNQRFLGVRSTFGDDRSLTNFILRDHRVTYNSRARSTTIAPDNWMWYMRQQCRWKKSWLREAPIAGRILARKHPLAALSFYASVLCSLASPYMAARFLWRDYTGALPGYIDGLLLLGLTVVLFTLWKRPARYWYVAWYWIATQILLSGPQTYYALLTVRKNHWGTR